MVKHLSKIGGNPLRFLIFLPDWDILIERKRKEKSFSFTPYSPIDMLSFFRKYKRIFSTILFVGVGYLCFFGNI
jgi:hypothetical protein